MSAAVAVVTPSNGTGGVEAVSRAVQRALAATGGDVTLRVGLRGVAELPRPAGPWVATTWKAHALALARHPSAAGSCLVVTHGAELTRDTGPVLRRLRQWSLDEAGLLLAVSPLTVQLLPRELLDRVELVGPPVRPVALPPGRLLRRAAGPRPLRLMSIGRAVPRKGHDTAIAVAVSLATRMPVRLDVVGPGSDLPRLRALAGLAAAAGYVRVHGQVDGDVKRRLLDQADVLLFLPRSEHGEYEGLGLVVLEAAAHAVPSVVLDCGGSRFAVPDARSGRVLDQQAPLSQIADAVLDLAGDPEAPAAARRVGEAFGLAAWEQRIRDVVGGRRPGWSWPAPTDRSTVTQMTAAEERP